MFFKNKKARHSNVQNRGAYDVIFLMALVILLLVFSAIAANIDFSGDKKSSESEETPALSTTVNTADATKKDSEEISKEKDTSTPPRH